MNGLAIINAVDLAEMVVKEEITKESIQGFEKRMEQRARGKIEYSFENGKKFWKRREWYSTTEYVLG
jgi:salicylate hydroxylase